MWKWGLVFILAFGAFGALGGCTPSTEKSEEEVKLLTEQNNVVANAFREGRGFEQLTPEEKERFMKGFDGDEEKAKKAFEKAAEGMAYFFGGGGGPAPAGK